MVMRSLCGETFGRPQEPARFFDPDSNTKAKAWALRYLAVQSRPDRARSCAWPLSMRVDMRNRQA
jgi:hypothetical protein